MASMISRRRSRRSERGAALVEFALVLPLLLVVIAGIVDFAFLFQRYEVVTNAAREGARIGGLPGFDSAAVRARVRAYVQAGLALSSAQMATVMPTSPEAVNVTYPTVSVTVGGVATTMNTVRVDVTYQHSFLLLGPMLSLINGSWGSTMNIVSSSQMRLEPGGGP